MRPILITGLFGPLGRLVLPLLGPDAGVAVVGLDARPAPEGPGHLDVEQVDPATAVFDEMLAGVDSLVLLSGIDGTGAGESGIGVATARRLLESADRAGVGAVVYLSSATVYGAWPDNAVPLTEDATLRPNPGLADAIEHAEVERLVAEWADEHPGATVAVLRPVPTLGRGAETPLWRGLARHAIVRPGEEDPLRQFVHAEDVASAVALAVRRRLDGVFNVAPDGSVAGDVLRGLNAGTPALPVPGWLDSTLSRLSWAVRLSELPPAADALVRYPWVVANDRLRASGWEPAWSTEEAVIAGRRGGRWREMGPGRRQEVALAVAGGLMASGAGAVAASVLRARARRRRSRASPIGPSG